MQEEFVNTQPLVKFELSVDEVNAVLKILQKEPYIEVKNLIEKIVSQAHNQPKEKPPE